MNFSYIMSESISLAEELGKYFADIEKLKVYSNVANESANYYTLANESIGEKLSKIGTAIKNFFLKIINWIRRVFAKVISVFRRKTSKAPNENKEASGTKPEDKNENNKNTTDNTKESNNEYYMWIPKNGKCGDIIENKVANAGNFVAMITRFCEQGNYDTTEESRSIETYQKIIDKFKDIFESPEKYKSYFEENAVLVHSSDPIKIYNGLNRIAGLYNECMKDIQKESDEWGNAENKIKNIRLKDNTELKSFQEAMSVYRKFATTLASLQVLRVKFLLRNQTIFGKHFDSKDKAEVFIVEKAN